MKLNNAVLMIRATTRSAKTGNETNNPLSTVLVTNSQAKRAKLQPTVNAWAVQNILNVVITMRVIMFGRYICSRGDLIFYLFDYRRIKTVGGAMMCHSRVNQYTNICGKK